jgi:hypothetical protein
MAGMAVPWRGGEISRGACIQGAFHTGHDGMFAVEFESKTGMAESLAKTIDPIVTVETGRPV